MPYDTLATLNLSGTGRPIYVRYIRLVRFLFLILIGRFVTLEP
jgi:hypothetical protein